MSRKKSKIKELSEPMQSCHTLLKNFLNKTNAEPFSIPVDWEAFGLTDYPEIITNPMDLGTVKSKLEDGKYSTPTEFAHDVRLVWSNAQRYNRQESDIFEAAAKLSRSFEKQFDKIKKIGKTKDRSRKEADVSRADRMKFCELVRGLSDDNLGQLVVMIQKNAPDALNEEDEHELEIEINNIDVCI